MRRTFTESLLLPLLVAAIVAGCAQQKDPNRPATYPVTGTVTYAGEAVEGATVNFQLVDGNRGAVGITDAQGKYSLSTFGANDGALPGSYKVSIVKYKTDAVDTGTAGGTMDENYVGPDPNEVAPEPENMLPAMYATPNSSGLTAEVSESGPNRFDFALEE